LRPNVRESYSNAKGQLSAITVMLATSIYDRGYIIVGYATVALKRFVMNAY
jgi:hypothetical protein